VTTLILDGDHHCFYTIDTYTYTTPSATAIYPLHTSNDQVQLLGTKSHTMYCAVIEN
jgi:hypothetical protein